MGVAYWKLRRCVCVDLSADWNFLMFESCENLIGWRFLEGLGGCGDLVIVLKWD